MLMKSVVRIIDLPDMASSVYHGDKATNYKQTKLFKLKLCAT